ncbi:MAG: DUF2892 domain-containing protein [bacterium]|nr:DUF2892 domain-containing protein [bacterium]
MCVDRVHRFLMASVLGLGAFLIHQSSPFGEYILWFVVGMLVVFGATNFCPSVWIMKKLGLKSCSPS